MSAIAIVRYEQPTKKEEHNEEEHNEEEHNGEPYNEGYGGAVVPVSLYRWCMVHIGTEPYGYDSEPLGPTESPNSDS